MIKKERYDTKWFVQKVQNAGTWPSWRARSMDSMGGDVESGEKIDREPRMHIMADLSSEKFSLHLSQWSVELYGLPCFSAK